MKVQLIAHTPDPEKVVAAAAKLCYSDCGIDDLLDGLTPEKTTRFLNHLSDLGHSSPTEHASFTFAIEGVSRSLLAQITRHRIASFSVQSQRYVKHDSNSNYEYIIPPSILEDGEASSVFADTMTQINDTYDKLWKILVSKNTEELMLQGFDMKNAMKKAEKMANEDARFVLPNAAPTKMILTMNARELNSFFKLRCCNRAQWEIRELANEMLRLVYPIAPNLFRDAGPACVSGACSEGLMTCSDSYSARQKNKEVKGNGRY